MLNMLSLANIFPRNCNRALKPCSINFVRSIRFELKGSEINYDRVVCGKWKAYNDKIFEPQAPGEKPRPGYVCHVKEGVKYSYKRMWYVACLIRGMSIDEALKQLQFVNYKGAMIATETLLEAQKMAVEDHNIEFKSNLWVSESFVGKSLRYKGFRRCAMGRMTPIHYDHIHYFVTLEEGTPPKYYYPHHKEATGAEKLEAWMNEMRNRKVIGCL